MPQQINLCAPVQYASSQRFTANSLGAALLVIAAAAIVMGAILSWNMTRSAAAYSQTLADQTRDMQGMHAALERAHANAAPADALLQQELKARQADVLQREVMLRNVRQGAVQKGFSHSDRLQLVASSIPSKSWITEFKADQGLFEITGYTLEPAALNDWVKVLGKSPLLKGLELNTVQVENVSSPEASALHAQVPAGLPPGRAAWLFHLVSAQAGIAPLQGERP